MQFDHDLTSRLVAEGFSGTAVWDRTNQCVVGMIVAKQTRDNMTSGYMIPMETLTRAWPALSSSGRGPDGGKPRLGPLVAKMCDRSLQDHGFWTFFQKTWESCPKQPQIFVIHGKEGECHESLVAHLRATRVSGYLQRQASGTVIQHNLPFGFDGDIHHRKRQLACQLTESLGTPSCAPVFTVEELCALPGIRDGKHPVVVLSHDLDAAKWDRHQERLVKWYVHEFWAMLECREDIPQFLIFLMVVYPDEDKQGIVDKFIRRAERCKKTAGRQLNQILCSAKAPCHCLFLSELAEIERGHVRHWFFKHRIPMSEKEKLDRIEALFAGKKTCPMADVEDALEKIVREQVSL